jgi:hypothetical protein
MKELIPIVGIGTKEKCPNTKIKKEPRGEKTREEIAKRLRQKAAL